MLRSSVMFAVLVLLGSCSGEQAEADPPPPAPPASEPTGPQLALFGLDGADWDSIDRLIEQGRMPNLARLKKEGAFGRLRSMEPMLSPILWTTIATGRTPEDHGVGWFMVDSQQSTQRIPVTSSVRKVRALWNILDGQGLDSGVIGWWATFPAEQIRGFVVSDYYAFHNFGVTGEVVSSDLGKVWPLSVLDEIDALRVRSTDVPMETLQRLLLLPEDRWCSVREAPLRFSDPASHLLHIVATAQTYTEVGLSLLESRRPDFFALYYEGIDSVSHIFQRFSDPRMSNITEEDHALYREVVDRYHEYQDELLGRFLEALPETCNVVIVSDHGFATGAERPDETGEISVPTAHLWHRSDGILLAHGPLFRRGEEVTGMSLLDVTPTLLHALDLPASEEMPGKVLLDLFKGSVLETRPCRRVPSYEDDPSSEEAVAHAKSKNVEVEESVSSMVEARLRALGYMGDESQAPTAEIHLNLGEQCFEKGDYAQAEKEFRLALSAKPEDVGARFWLGRTLFAARRFEDARATLRDAARLAPGNVQLVCLRSAVEEYSGRLDEALALLEEASSRSPDDPSLLLATSNLLSKLGRLEESLAASDHAIEVDPSLFPPRFNRAVVLQTLGRIEEAAAAYEEILEQRPDSPMVLVNLGHLRLAGGDADAAIELFQRAFDVAPENFETNWNLGSMQFDRGDLESAEGKILTAVRLRPDEFDCRRALALLYARTERFDKAFEEWGRLAQIHPNQPEPCYRMGRILWGAKEEEAAKVQLREALRRGGEVASGWIRDDEIFQGLDVEELLRGEGAAVEDRGAAGAEASEGETGKEAVGGDGEEARLVGDRGAGG